MKTISELENFGVNRSRNAVHDWVQKADLQPVSDQRTPNHIALDETVIRIDGDQYWLYTAVDPETTNILHTRLYAARTIALTEQFLRELRDNHDIEDALFLVDRGPWLQAVLQRHGLRFHHETHGNCNTVERVYSKVKRRTSTILNILITSIQ